jgi:hypothetical protein
MISRNPALPGALAASLLLASSLPGPAAEAGAWETFDSLANSDAWSVFDFSTEGVYYLNWQQSTGGDGFVYFWNEDDFPLWFFTDPLIVAGEGKMIGDYASENVQGIIADVYIAAPEIMANLECAIRTTGAFGEDYYFSVPYTGEDFAGEGWYTLRFGFEMPWVHYGVAGPETVTVDTQFLTDITEIGFVYTPVAGATQDVPFAMDNVKLEPKVVKPAVTSSVSGTTFTMSFIPGDGVTCNIEKMQLPPETGWLLMGEHFGLTGTTPYVFTTPVLTGPPATAKEFFRVNYEAIYTPFVTPPTGP